MSTKTEAEITEQLVSDGWLLTHHCTNEGSPDCESIWQVTLTRKSQSFTTEYRKGSAHRRWKKSGFGVLPLGFGTWKGILPKHPKAGETIPQLHGRRTLAQQELLDTRTEPKPPTLDEVLYSLLMDSSGIRDGQTFEDWCSEYGSDSDSIKARQTFDACRDEWAALIRMGADFDALDALFQDY